MIGPLLSLVQLVAGVAIVSAPCPGYLPAKIDCYEPQTLTIYAPLGRGRRDAIAHEYGHAWDAEKFTPADRARVTVLLGFKASTPWWGRGVGVDDYSPAEVFAETYRVCALGGGRRAAKTQDRWVPRPAVARVCRMLPPSDYARLVQAFPWGAR